MTLLLDRKIQTGLSKLVLINSGVSEYVELETNRVTHLAGENGLGKTSILSTLQFLMIDNWRNMKFVMDQADTEEHYFPDDRSSIIFEIITQEKSTHMIIFRGNNIADDKRYSRYYVDGSYDKSLFINSDNIPMEWEDVFVYMAEQGREVTPLKNPAELRNKLRSLKWLPTKDKENVHDDFVTLLKTLNTLGTVKENDIKQVLLNINPGIQTRIDFNMEFGDSWHRHVKRRKLVSVFDANTVNVHKLSDYFHGIQTNHSELQELCDACGPSVAFYNSDFESIKKKKLTEIAEMEKERLGFESEAKTLDSDCSRKINELTELAMRISDGKKLQIWADKQNIPALEEKAKAAREEYSDIEKAFSKLQNVNLTTEQIDREIIRMEKKIANDTRQLESKSSTILFDIISNGFGKNSLVLSYLSSDLLKSEGRITDKSRFTSFISELESSVSDGKVDFNGLEIDDITQFINEIIEDPTILEAMINENIVRHKDLERQLLIATDNEKQTAIMQKKKMEMENTQSELTKLKKWENFGFEEYESKIKSHEELEIILQEIKRNLNDKNILVQQTLKSLNTKKSEISNLGKEIEVVNQMWDGIIEELGDGFAYNQKEQLPMSDLILELQRGASIEKKIRIDTKKFIQIQDKIMPLFSELLPYTTRDEFIQQLIDLHTTIEEQREKIEKEWNHLFDNISRSANLMRNGIRTLKQEVSGINKIFNDIQVSNLDTFVVEFKMKSNNLEYFAELNSFSKHSTDVATIQSMERVGRELINRRSINLADEFGLEFQVKFKGAKKAKIVKNLDQAGSTGTIVLIKAVLLMILLYKRVQTNSRRVPLPFFLDEVGVFGANNKGQIVEVARKLDFQIFTASPDSMEDADLVYPILGGRENDRILVIPHMGISQTDSSEEEE